MRLNRPLEEQFEPEAVRRIRSVQERLDRLQITYHASRYFVVEATRCLEAGLLLAALQVSTAMLELLVRETLAENPELNTEQLNEITGVSVDCILRMIDSGSMQLIASGDGEAPTCGRCGAPAISMTKKLCQSCLEKLNREVAQAQKGIRLGEKKKVQVGEFQSVHSTMKEKRR